MARRCGLEIVALSKLLMCVWCLITYVKSNAVLCVRVDTGEVETVRATKIKDGGVMP